jgi:glycosyltransferase involved in cell wall biosynthesis
MNPMPTPSTVIFCCNTAFGIAHFRGGAIRELVRRGHRVVAVAPRDEHVDALTAMGADFVHWGLSGRSTGPLAEAASLLRLVRIYCSLDADIAFHFTIKAVLYGAVAARFARVPFVSVITGLGYVFLNETLISKLAWRWYSATLHWARAVWFLNSHDRAEFLRLGLVAAGQTYVLPGEGIDTVHFAATPTSQHGDGRLVILMIARLLKDKGVFEYVEAARLVRAQRPEVRFQLLGPLDTINPTAIAKTQLDAWCAESVIEYLGVVRDVRPYISAADAVVLPSYREGTSRSLLEAAAIARPIIATDVPGCREVVMDGESGLLCRPRDADDLSRCLLRFVDMSAEQRLHMGLRSRALIESHFDERLVIERYVALVEGRLPAD